jgi:hypothetical protein
MRYMLVRHLRYQKSISKGALALRTTVKGLGQIEIDEVYTGVDRHGCQYIIPMQAKGGNDRLSKVQAKQDFACCAEKFPNLICRAV